MRCEKIILQATCYNQTQILTNSCVNLSMHLSYYPWLILLWMTIIIIPTDWTDRSICDNNNNNNTESVLLLNNNNNLTDDNNNTE